MAKKQNLTDIFAKTEPSESQADNSDLDEGNIRATGIGLRAGELRALDDMAARLGIARNALLRFAVRWFIVQYRTGKVDPGQYLEEPPPPKKTLRLPGQ